MARLQRDQIDLYFERHGPAPDDPELSDRQPPPLILVAGLASDSQSWASVLPTLAAERQVLVYDNRGCGRSQPQATANSIALMADDCLALADHLGLERFDLLGHSMGGLIALEVARRAPQRLSRLVLSNSAAAQSARNQQLFEDWADDLDAGKSRARWFRNFFYWIFTERFFADPAAVEGLLELVLSYPYPATSAGFRSQVEAMRGFDARPWLSRIEAPTLILACTEDLLFPPRQDAAGLASIPAAELRLLRAQAHSLPLEAPAAFCEAVLRFLERPV
jgi:pimeloyl-ACP methyl ester carboxylesterase